MDGINALAAGSRRAEVAFDAAAQQLAAADLPTAGPQDPTNPTNPAPPGPDTVPGVDVAGQLVAMTVAADVHHATTAAMRSALSLYRDSIDLLSQ